MILNIENKNIIEHQISILEWFLKAVAVVIAGINYVFKYIKIENIILH